MNSPKTRRPQKLVCEQLEPRQMMANDLAVDVILEWNEVLLQANAADHARTSPEQGGPILTSRAFAMVSGAMYDAYNSVQRIGTPFVHLAHAKPRADEDMAVAQAAHDTLIALYPSQQARFDNALSQTMSRIRSPLGIRQGRAVGAEVAAMVLAARATDGVDFINDTSHSPVDEPGFHQVDPLHPSQGYYATGAAQIDPFVIRSVDQFAAPRLDDGTPAGRLAFLQSDVYEEAFQEVKRLGGDGVTSPTDRTPEQTRIGQFWAYDGRPDIGTPPRLYNQIVQTIAKQQRNRESENARLFALVNIAMADAGLAAWGTKYEDDFWRPILGVRGGDIDGNPATVGDAAWIPLGAPASNPRPGDTNFTPSFPAYVSGHATFGAAMFEMVENFYHTDRIRFTFVSDELNGTTLDADGSTRPRVPRTFHSLTQAKMENAQSRIYLGIHWSFDASQGIAVGDSVADYIYRRALRPSQGRDRGDDWNDHHSSRRSHDANTHSGSSMAPPIESPYSVHELALIELTDPRRKRL